MKKCLQFILLFCLVLSAMMSKAQSTIGIRAGVNLAQYNIDYGSNLPAGTTVPPNQNATLLTIGFPFEKSFSPLFALQVELDYIQKGVYQHSDQTTQGFRFVSDYNLTIHWMEIPVFGKIKFGSPSDIGGGIFFGPSFGFALSGRTKNSFSSSGGTTISSSTDEAIDFKRDDHSRVDLALNLGGDFNYKQFFFDARYQLGLANMVTNTSGTNSSNGIKATTRGIMLTVGYRFALNPIEKAPDKKKKK